MSLLDINESQHCAECSGHVTAQRCEECRALNPLRMSSLTLSETDFLLRHHHPKAWLHDERWHDCGLCEVEVPGFAFMQRVADEQGRTLEEIQPQMEAATLGMADAIRHVEAGNPPDDEAIAEAARPVSLHGFGYLAGLYLLRWGVEQHEQRLVTAVDDLLVGALETADAVERRGR